MSNKLVIRFFFFVCPLLLCKPLFAQWSGKYGNEWIVYDNKYVKINVTEAGLYKLPLSSLPAGFSKDPLTLQMWHRGKEISIVQVDNQEIWFYAEINDGSSDSLLYRPTSARLNPYQSFFSDQGVYFLTNAKNPKRAVKVDKIQLTGQPEGYHLQTTVVSLRDQFALATLAPVPLILNNSYYENLNSWTGPVIYGDSSAGHTVTNVISTNTFSFSNYQSGTGVSPVLNVMLNGLHFGKHEVQMAVGKSASSSDLSTVATVNFTGLGSVKREGIILKDAQFTPENGGVLSLRSKTKDVYDWFSLSYYTITYPQKVKMEMGKQAYFNFPPTASKVSQIRIETVGSPLTVLDISNPYEPRILQGTQSGANLELMAPRTDNAGLKLLSANTDQLKTVPSGKIALMDFSPLFTSSSISSGTSAVSPGAYDYLIITSDTLKAGAIEYARYRSSPEGGGFNTIVYESKNLYNQFNYGEPGPVGIKRFVEFMLKSGVRDKHNLLLVGLGISAPDAEGLRLKKDPQQDVPTFGDPGSDVLLVAGLHGLGQDMPAIPVGRINAFNEQHVINYLNKVKEYEADKSAKGWQKNILHLNGGKTADEISQMSSILRNLNPFVQNSAFGGEVKAFVKQSTIETETVDISKEVNTGVGMISYFGHGSPYVTDLDMGKVSEAGRNYNNPSKYPLMYFNGCGVGSIYTGRSVFTLSTDWLLSPNIGAVAVIANSFNSYVSPTVKQLGILYDELFVKNTSANLSIGQITQNVARRVLAASPDIYDIANIHQSNLQGDPAIRLFNAPNPDYAFNVDKPLMIVGEAQKKTIGASSKLQAGFLLVNNGKYVKGQSVPLKISYIYKSGQTDIRVQNFDSFAFKDTVFADMPADSRNIARIEVDIDLLNTVVELDKKNNSAGLNIDWDVANKLLVYPEGAIKDIIPPSLTVTMNGRVMKNEESLLPDPTINVQLVDDNLLALDPALFELYIKPCWEEGCNYQKIEIGSTGLVAVSDREIILNQVLKDLKAGNYEILVNGKDKAGNNISGPYNIRFSISSDAESRVALVVSPNPASDYIRFDSEAGDAVESVNYTIYNLAGKVISYSAERVKYIGKQTWYWLRKDAPAGLYLYQVEVVSKDKSPVIIKGKVVLK